MELNGGCGQHVQEKQSKKPARHLDKKINRLLKATQSYAKQLVQELVRERYLQQGFGELLAGQMIPP